jgi:predicted amidohydrolase YtcJ
MVRESRLSLYVNGRLHLPVGARPADALAVRGGAIVWVGNGAAARDLAAGARVYDLQGAPVWPGLVDSHIHFLWTGLSLADVDLDGLGSLAEAVAAVGARARGLEPGGWIRGGGWNVNIWREGRWPTAADLDAVAPRNPVALASKDRHSLWVNGRALELARIGTGTEAPPGGEISRDEHGAPTGVLKENAQALVQRVMPAPSAAECLEALQSAQRLAHSMGLVGIHNMEGPDALSAFQQLRAAGELHLRVLHSIPSASLDHALALGLRSGMGDEWLRIGGVKIFTDGALGSQTAALFEPFEGSDNRGILVHEPAAFAEMVRRAWAGGLSLTVHAIGDRANRLTLDAFARVQNGGETTHAPGGSWGRPLLPNRVEHAQLLHPADVGRFGASGVIASMQPIHCTSDRDTADRQWGARSAGAYAFRSLLETGATLAFGSDAPVESCNPFWGLYAAITRRRLGREEPSWYPEQLISLNEALAAYTLGAAVAAGDEGRRGALVVGMPADFVVLPPTLDLGDPEAVGRATPLATVVGGEVVFGELES